MRSTRAIVLFLLLLVFWQLLSWRLDPLFLVMGLGSAALVTRMSLPLLDAVLGTRRRADRVHLLRLLSYLVWLLTRLPSAGLHVARVVLDPRVPPRPGVARFRTQLSSPAARTLLANSITLVPGTMTLDVDGQVFTVHAFTPASMGDLANAATQRRIARIFGDPPDPHPEISWEDADPAVASGPDGEATS